MFNIILSTAFVVDNGVVLDADVARRFARHEVVAIVLDVDAAIAIVINDVIANHCTSRHLDACIGHTIQDQVTLIGNKNDYIIYFAKKETMGYLNEVLSLVVVVVEEDARGVHPIANIVANNVIVRATLDLVSRAHGAASTSAATNTGVMARVILEQRIAENRRATLTAEVEALACFGSVPHLTTSPTIKSLIVLHNRNNKNRRPHCSGW